MGNSAHIVDTARGPVEVAQFGTMSGPPAVMVHGSPGGYDHGVLMGQFLARKGFRVLAPSRPGYLRTPLQTATATPDGQADLLAALLDALGIKEAGVLSWSGGGPTGYRFAARYPERTTSLVALAALSRRYDWQTDRGDRFFLGTVAGNALLSTILRGAPARVVEATLQSVSTLSDAEVTQRTAEIMADDQRREFVLSLVRATSLRGRRKPGVANDRQQFATMGDLGLAHLKVPTLVVQGDADADVEPAFSDFAHDRIPGSELLTMPGGTHLCLFVDPGYRDAQERVARFLTPEDSPQSG